MVTLAVLLSLGFGEAPKRRIQGDANASLQMVTDNTAAFLAHGLFERIREVQVLADARVIWRQGPGHCRSSTSWPPAGHATPQPLAGCRRPRRGSRATGNMLPGLERGRTALVPGMLVSAPWATSIPRQTAGKPVAPTKSGDPYRFVDFAAPIRIGSTTVGVLGVHGYWEWSTR